MERLRHEREKATQNRNKYAGVSSEEARYGGSSGGGFNSSSNSNSRYGGFGSDSYRKSITNIFITILFD